MNPTARSLFSFGIAIALPVSSVLANGPHRSSSSRSGGGRFASQSRPGFQSGPAFSRSGAGFQRSASFSRANAWNSGAFNANRAAFNGNRLAINRSATNWNRFNAGTNRIVSNRNGWNRFAGNGFNRGGNWWRYRHHRDFDNFIFFGGFGFPFFSSWDYGYYPSAYYPYYPSSSYYYDPYSYSYGAPTYPDYGDGAYSDGPGYSDPGYGRSRNYDNTRRYSRNGTTHNDSMVALVQEQLARDGYYKGAIDGVEGSRTYYAIRAYQRDHNLQVDGEITDEVLQAMGLR